MDNSPVIKITDALPVDLVCERLGVKPRSIRAARETRLFPASWYREIKLMCADAGIECPDDAFNWKASENTKGRAA